MINEHDIKDMWSDWHAPLASKRAVEAQKMWEESVQHDTNPVNDPVNHPKHYTNHPSGIECIQITQHMNFLMGNAMKYLWRADLKNGVEDLKKAVWYLNREIEARTKGKDV